MIVCSLVRIKNLIFHLANRVLLNTANEDERRWQAKQVLDFAAAVILFVHGFKQVSGVSRLTKRW